jgi:hypothetical protein
MMNAKESMDWLAKWMEEYHSTGNDIGEIIEDFGDVGKLRRGFTSIDELDQIDIGDGGVQWPRYVNTNLRPEQKKEARELLRTHVDCFAWEYTEMPGLERSLVEHQLPLKRGFWPHKQPARNFSAKIVDTVKEEVGWLLKAGFIQPCRYVEPVSNIVPVEKKNTRKIRVCVNFRDLNRATPKDEYPMPVADTLISSALGNKVICFLEGNVGYNQIFMAAEDMHKTAFRCPGFVGLFEWVVMTFGLKNTGAMYQRAVNLIFHDLLGVILEVYIDDVMVKSAGFAEHLADLQLALERMRRYGLRMNSLKFTFGVSAGQFLGFVVHEGGIQVDPKKIESIKRLGEPTCKRDV